MFDREPFAESFIGLVIRTDYLEQVGMDVPVTYDDWYNVLKAFKEKTWPEVSYVFCADV